MQQTPVRDLPAEYALIHRMPFGGGRRAQIICYGTIPCDLARVSWKMAAATAGRLDHAGGWAYTAAASRGPSSVCEAGGSGLIGGLGGLPRVWSF